MKKWFYLFQLLWLCSHLKTTGSNPSVTFNLTFELGKTCTDENCFTNKFGYSTASLLTARNTVSSQLGFNFASLSLSLFLSCYLCLSVDMRHCKFSLAFTLFVDLSVSVPIGLLVFYVLLFVCVSVCLTVCVFLLCLPPPP